MQRIELIKAIAQIVTAEDLCVSSIGAVTDDWNNHAPSSGNTLYLGMLGSITPAALGIALSLPHRRVIALETDGSVLMNTGAMCTLGCERPANLTVLVMDNGIYENIGGPPTHTSRNTDLARMAEGAGCLNAVTVRDVAGLQREFTRMLTDGEMGYLVAKIEPGKYPWKWEQRKQSDGVEDKYRFMRFVEKIESTVIHPGAQQN
jgi:thiamine pyrophosphate-dependent acetolactate synthase large subunit-like protein